MFGCTNHHRGNAAHSGASWQPPLPAISKIRRGKKKTNLACHAEKLLRRAIQVRASSSPSRLHCSIKMTQERDIAEQATKGAPGLVNNEYNSSGTILKAARRKAAKSEAVICIDTHTSTHTHTLIPQHQLDTAQFCHRPLLLTRMHPANHSQPRAKRVRSEPTSFFRFFIMFWNLDSSLSWSALMRLASSRRRLV